MNKSPAFESRWATGHSLTVVIFPHVGHPWRILRTSRLPEVLDVTDRRDMCRDMCRDMQSESNTGHAVIDVDVESPLPYDALSREGHIDES